MASETKPAPGPCTPACTKIVQFMNDRELPPSVGISLPPYTSIDGYGHINIFVRFTQAAEDEPPVDLGVIFAFDANGTMGARRYVNVEQNLSGPQSTNFIEVSGRGSWHGSPHNISSYWQDSQSWGRLLRCLFTIEHRQRERSVCGVISFRKTGEEVPGSS